MFKLAINAGHGYHTLGKRCMKSIDPNETREWSLNSRVEEKVIEKLKAYEGYELIRLDDPTGERNIPLKTRTDKANAFGADFYLSIHHNAGIKGRSGGGIVAFVQRGTTNPVTLAWQKELYEAAIKYTGLRGDRWQPLAQSNLHETREPDMPSVLMECGFMDSTVDTPIILTEKFADQISDAFVEVLVRRGRLTKKEDSKPTPEVSDKVIYQVWDDVRNAWLPEVVNARDYAGIVGHDICGVFANINKGNIYYKVHYKGGRWLPEVKNREDYAGILNKPIDAIMLRTDDGSKIKYRVHLRKQNRWLPWATGYNEYDYNNGYAGIFKQEIDLLQIDFLK